MERSTIFHGKIHLISMAINHQNKLTQQFQSPSTLWKSPTRKSQFSTAKGMAMSKALASKDMAFIDYGSLLFGMFNRLQMTWGWNMSFFLKCWDIFQRFELWTKHGPCFDTDCWAWFTQQKWGFEGGKWICAFDNPWITCQKTAMVCSVLIILPKQHPNKVCYLACGKTSELATSFACDCPKLRSGSSYDSTWFLVPGASKDPPQYGKFRGTGVPKKQGSTKKRFWLAEYIKSVIRKLTFYKSEIMWFGFPNPL